MKTGKEYAELAQNPKYDNLKYDQYDCQAFCELVLRDLGVRSPSGAPYNWKGSNDMYRNAVSWVGTIAECKRTFGEIPLGAWAFMWDQTGNEKKRGYYDGKGNASHIGIYIGNDKVRDSTKIKNASGQVIRDGVGIRPLSNFQKIGIPACLDFAREIPTMEVEISRSELEKVIDSLQDIITKIKGWV